MTSKTEWISVGALGDAFAPDNHCLEASAALLERRLTLHFADGAAIEHHFISATELRWTVLQGGERGAAQTERYQATSLRDGVYFVDFVKSGERATTVSLVLDLERDIFTALTGRLPTREDAAKPLSRRVAEGLELTPVGAAFSHGAIGAPCTAETPAHQATGALIGKRVQYTYSPHEVYEHIYLNERFYTWHCLLGSERGLTDTDACDYLHIGDELYLFVWREKTIPTLGVIMIDLQRMKTTGKIFGYEGDDFTAVRNFPVGAHCRILNTTERVPA